MGQDRVQKEQLTQIAAATTQIKILENSNCYADKRVTGSVVHSESLLFHSNSLK